jgi:RNA polymerase sigma-70 factor (ECF subfamily)
MENVSVAFLFLLEKLTPLERAVFILKESLDFAHKEIAAMLGIETAHSRQLLRRARDRLGEIPDSTCQLADDESKAVMQRFTEALASRDLESLRQLLTDDIIAYSDGGGRVAAALIPLVGFDKVTTVLLHLVKRGAIPEESRWHIINGAWGRVMYEDGGVHSVTTVEIRDGKICRIYTMRNPDKLGYVGKRTPAGS